MTEINYLSYVAFFLAVITVLLYYRDWKTEKIKLKKRRREFLESDLFKEHGHMMEERKRGLFGKHR